MIIIKIIEPQLEETYQEYIDRILQTRENLKDPEYYQEKHHIIPKSKGGSNDKNNLIFLYAQEHYYAHKLLALENEEDYGLQLAWWNMSVCRVRDRAINITPEEFAQSRIRASVAASNLKQGVPLSDTHREHLYNKKGCKPVVNITTGDEYKSTAEASRATGISSSHIAECCKLKRSHARFDAEKLTPYIWRYKGEEDIPPSQEPIHLTRKVVCIEDNTIYNSIKEASRKIGVAKTTILRDCRKASKRQKIKRKHFKYLNESN